MLMLYRVTNWSKGETLYAELSRRLQCWIKESHWWGESKSRGLTIKKPWSKIYPLKDLVDVERETNNSLLRRASWSASTQAIVETTRQAVVSQCKAVPPLLFHGYPEVASSGHKHTNTRARTGGSIWMANFKFTRKLKAEKRHKASKIAHFETNKHTCVYRRQTGWWLAQTEAAMTLPERESSELGSRCWFRKFWAQIDTTGHTGDHLI